MDYQEEHGPGTRRFPRFTLLALVIVVLLARLLFLPFLFPSPEEPERVLYTDEWGFIARNLAEGYGYVHPIPSPDAKRGPVPVLWLAGIFLLFGQSVWAVMIGNWLLDVGTAVILFSLARHIFPRKQGVAILTVLMFAFYVPHIQVTYQAKSEPIFTLFLMLHLLTLIHLLNRPSLGRAAMAGLYLGLAALARSVMLAFPAVVLGLMLFRYRRLWPTVKYFGALALMFAVILSPWIVRNYLTFHAFVPGTSVVGFNLIKNHYYLDSTDYLRELYPRPVLEAEMERLLNARGDSMANYDPVSLDKIYAREAWARISRRPDRYLVLSAIRLLRMWFYVDFVKRYDMPSRLVAWSVAGIHATLLAMAAIGSIRERRVRTHPAIPLLWITILFFTITHVPIHGQPRYIFPVMPLVMLLAAPFIYEVLAKLYTLIGSLRFLTGTHTIRFTR